MLHFSARWGLDKLTMQLLECPGGEAAISMRNINGKTPLELAEQYLHVKCVEILKNFSVRISTHPLIKEIINSFISLFTCSKCTSSRRCTTTSRA